MKRQELEKIIFSDYKVIPDSPWIKYPEDKVFRHPENKKWFALVMTITKDKLGIKGNDKIIEINLTNAIIKEFENEELKKNGKRNWTL